MSAFLHDLFGQEGTRLRAVFWEQFLLVDTQEQALLGLQLFQTPAASLGYGHGDFVPVSDNQPLGLVQEKLVSQDSIDNLTGIWPVRQIAVDSVDLLAKWHKNWTPARSQTSLASVRMPELSSAVARSLQRPTVTLGNYLDSVHLIVRNFAIVRGDFPIDFLHQLMHSSVDL